MTALPTRDGVSPSCIALPKGAWPTMFDFLVQQFPAVPAAQWQARMLRGDVIDANGVPVLPQRPYQAYLKIYYYRELPDEAPIPFAERVLFQDDYLVVADKPHFLPVTPSGHYLQQTLLVRLKRTLGIDTLVPMHRIDRDTAGLVLLTIQPATRDAYQALFRERTVVKTYEAIAPWRADLALPLTYRSRLAASDAFMQMREVPGPPNAETGIELLQVQGALARYRLRPSTGQKHQLRAHMAALGIAIVNDRIYPHLYPVPDSAVEPDYSQPLQLLAKTLEFVDPISGQLRQFSSQRSLML